MPELSVKLTPITVDLGDLLLDPNNPRFATSLNLPEPVPDKDVLSSQPRVRGLFITDRTPDSGSEDDEPDGQEGPVEIGDLIQKMKQIGFIPIDQIVVRQLRVKSKKPQYLVIEGNRRVSAAKHLLESKPEVDQEKRKHHDWVLSTITRLDVLLLYTEGLTDGEIHHQIGVILGLRHFGSVLGWGPLAKAVNIFNEYMATKPAQIVFRLDSQRLTSVVNRLSVPRSHVDSALKTYIAYRQLQEAFPEGPPRPTHYSLVQACVTNAKLETSRFLERDRSSYQLSAASIENINKICEFENRDEAKRPDEMPNILSEDKAVSALAGLISDSISNHDDAVRSFAASLRDEVLCKERPLADAVDNLKTFKSDRGWTEALSQLLKKAESELDVNTFHAKGNELLKLEEAQKAFSNVRKILDV